MGYHPRIENPELATLNTSKSRNAELWFINNVALEKAILGYLAKYKTVYKLKLYAFAIEGNHLHSVANFPEGNRADFFRIFNSMVARAIPRYCPSYGSGRFWARRYSAEFLPGNDDIENWFFYTVMQPIQDGLVDRLSECRWYQCFMDAISGVARQYEVVDWSRYNERKRYDKTANIKDFTHTYTLSYDRLPGYEDMTQEEYKAMMLKKYEERRLEIIAKRNKPAAGARLIARKEAGSRPSKTKTSDRYSHRPRVLSINRERREKYTSWYFHFFFTYKVASKEFRTGNLNTGFPPGMYRPPLFTCKPEPLDMSFSS